MKTSEDNALYDLAQLTCGRITPEQISTSRWVQINRVAIRNGLSPLLYSIVEQLDVCMLNPAVFQDLACSVKINSFNSQFLLDSQVEIKKALVRNGIPVIWLKGIALAQTLYSKPYLRPMDDLDLLVPYELRQAALDVIQSIGFHFPRPDVLTERIGVSLDFSHHYHLVGGPANRVQLDLHFRLIGDGRLLPLDELGWFWRQSEVVEHLGVTHFKPEAHFLFLCAHAIIQHGEAEFRLQRYYDLHQLISQRQMDWDLIITRAVELGWTYAVERALLITCHYFSTQIPENVFSELSKHRQSDEEITRARRLQGAGYRWENTLYSLSKVSMHERFCWIFHLTFPPAAYMRSRYSIPAGNLIFPYYFFRWLDAGFEICSAALRRIQPNILIRQLRKGRKS